MCPKESFIINQESQCVRSSRVSSFLLSSSKRLRIENIFSFFDFLKLILIFLFYFETTTHTHAQADINFGLIKKEIRTTNLYNSFGCVINARTLFVLN